jgi:hypothetical protein
MIEVKRLKTTYFIMDNVEYNSQLVINFLI